MASRKLEEKIKQLTDELIRLTDLRDFPLEIPEGMKLAKVSGLDWSDAKYEQFMPHVGDFVVVPNEFEDTVKIYGSRGGTFVDETNWIITSWGETPEEASAAHLLKPNHWEKE